MEHERNPMTTNNTPQASLNLYPTQNILLPISQPNSDNTSIANDRKFTPFYCRNISTQGKQLLWISLIYVNFDRVVLGNFTLDILQYISRKIHNKLNMYYYQGRVLRFIIDNTNILTGGNIFKYNFIILVSNILQYHDCEYVLDMVV